MGAVFISTVVETGTSKALKKKVSGCFGSDRIDSLARKQLESLYRGIYALDRSYHGTNPYSGSWSACGEGLDIRPERFRDVDKAHQHVMDAHEKYECPIAVKLTGKNWLIGAWAPE